MNENNQQEPSINKLIEEGEEINKRPQSFFKKPIGIAIITLVAIVLIVLIFILLTDRTADNGGSTQPPSSEDKMEILERLSKENTTNTTQEEKLNILEELSKQQENSKTREEKIDILNSLSN